MLLAVSVVFGGIGFAGWFYRVPEYVLTYTFLAAFAGFCLFMQCWRVILPLFGIQPKGYAYHPQAGPQPSP